MVTARSAGAHLPLSGERWVRARMDVTGVPPALGDVAKSEPRNVVLRLSGGVCEGARCSDPTNLTRPSAVCKPPGRTNLIVQTAKKFPPETARLRHGSYASSSRAVASSVARPLTRSALR